MREADHTADQTPTIPDTHTARIDVNWSAKAYFKEHGRICAVWQPKGGESTDQVPERYWEELAIVLLKQKIDVYLYYLEFGKIELSFYGERFILKPGLEGKVTVERHVDAKQHIVDPPPFLAKHLTPKPEPPPWPPPREFREGTYSVFFGRNSKQQRVVVLQHGEKVVSENLDHPSTLGHEFDLRRASILTRLWERLSAGGLVGMCTTLSIEALELLYRDWMKQDDCLSEESAREARNLGGWCWGCENPHTHWRNSWNGRLYCDCCAALNRDRWEHTKDGL